MATSMTSTRLRICEGQRKRTDRAVCGLSLGDRVQRTWQSIREWEEITRPHGSQRANVLLQERYDNLPEHVKGPNQMLGRVSPGCEGTQGVFPKCTFNCKPCYHSADANKVRVDGLHTVVEVARQMETLSQLRGPHGHCQLIGGEVSLLAPEDHAAALEVMHKYGRVPMSFSHGDFSYEYLRKLAVDDSGKRRFERLYFAVHFDRFMVGRSGAVHPSSEEELDVHRRELIEKFKRLRREHGVDFYVAHNMTVQPGNVGELKQVLRANLTAGYRMFSFQPAAFQGDQRRWTADYAKVAADDGGMVWKEIEEGAGSRLPYKALQMGDPRCNRQCIGFVVAKNSANPRFVPILDDEDRDDMVIRDAFVQKFGSFVMPARLLAVKFVRSALRNPLYLWWFARWLVRFLRRAGGLRAVLGGVMFITIVMHRFMDAENVKKAWDLMERGVEAEEPKIKETQERLQHAVYDPVQNVALREKLPLNEPSRSAAEALSGKANPGGVDLTVKL